MLGIMKIAGPIWTDSNHVVGSVSVDAGMEGVIAIDFNRRAGSRIRKGDIACTRDDRT